MMMSSKNNVTSSQFLNEEGILRYKASEFEEAVSCWKKAAEAGSASAMFELGIMHLIGCVLDKDVLKARQYFKQSADLGHKNAIRYLECGNLSELEAEIFSGNDKTCTTFPRMINFAGYEWLVLERQENMCFCLMKDIISIRPYHDRQENITWKNCTLRKWLNEEFISSFSPGGQNLILFTHTEGLNDKLFLLSADETAKYLGESDCTARRAIINMTHEQIAECEALYGHSYAKVNGQYLGWWLRDSGSSPDKAARINCNGWIRLHGRAVNSCIDGVRPACWINLPEDGSNAT